MNRMLGAHHFERSQAMQLDVLDLIHDPETTASKLFEDSILSDLVRDPQRWQGAHVRDRRIRIWGSIIHEELL
jgi:hypothetical protein